ncbi:cytochrome c oxidase assembly protein COX18, mitochondrial [Morone saxatilis]|uniref:cytochrome c oxidase assembly protein COX18, mitochondrial n=1 Tax=Morone saxatilis TaxID=34816 RepID=UPI0015E243F5|nr:cytochrome c oxidase assembly protein COX18, mitochondrial [Morone saxatilis]
MLSVGGSLRSGVLQVPVRGLCSAVNRKSPPPGPVCSGPPTAGLLAVWTRSGSSTLSGLWTSTGVRRFSGGGGPGAPGWYSRLSDSAPVHLCEDFLVGVQQVSGLPWWLSIAMATLSVRSAVTLPLAAYQLIILAKVEVLQEEISELAKRLRYEVSLRARERGWTEKQSR